MTAINKPNAAEYCQRNTLVLPRALFAMADVQVLMHAGDAAICYKQLTQNLVDVEFYSQAPCLVYIASGKETITSSDNQPFEFSQDDLFLLPKGEHLHSDFVRSTDALSAYLLFFDEIAVSQFVQSHASKSSQLQDNSPPLLVFSSNEGIESYFSSLASICRSNSNSADLLKLKLLEILYLIAPLANGTELSAVLSSASAKGERRNIKRVMNIHALSPLTVQDFAHLTGRSLSTFTRDFKSLYGMPPKQWLTSYRLAFAKSQLSNPSYVSSVTELATELGYQNTSHFISAFKVQYGVTPKQYRLAAQETVLLTDFE